MAIRSTNMAAFGRHLITALVLAAAPALQAARTFDEGEHGASRLEYVGEVPVLRLFGTPAEMGQAAGVLTRDAIRLLASDFVEAFLKFMGADPGSAEAARQRARVRECLAGVPPGRRQEMDALARGAGIDPELIYMANLLPELTGRVRCSTLFIGGPRMSDENPWLGRNLDYPPLAGLDRFSLVVVYHEKGRRALASFTFPGLVGVLTGLNQDGLFGATMDVMRGARKYRPDAIPRFFYYRELLTTHENVERLLKALGPECLSGGNFMVADSLGRAALLESPGAGWEVRRPSKDMLYATNHFVSPALGRPPACDRFAALAERDRTMGQFTPNYAMGMIRLVALKPINIQALILRPATGSVLFAFGAVPAAMGRFHPLERTSLFGEGAKPAPAGSRSR